jgi:hypothetical protein
MSLTISAGGEGRSDAREPGRTVESAAHPGEKRGEKATDARTPGRSDRQAGNIHPNGESPNKESGAVGEGDQQQQTGTKRAVGRVRGGPRLEQRSPHRCVGLMNNVFRALAKERSLF